MDFNAVSVVRKFLAENTDPCSDPEGYARPMHSIERVLEFLTSRFAGHIPIYVSGEEAFLYSVFVNPSMLGDKAAGDLVSWNFGAARGWSYGTEVDEVTGEDRPIIIPPLSLTGTTVLEEADPILFQRYFDGYDKSRRSYVELNQRLAHVTDSHYVSSRNAYCKLDENGEFVDTVTLNAPGGSTLCTIDQSALDRYMFVSGQVLVRLFDIHLLNPIESIDGFDEHTGIVERPDIGLYARYFGLDDPSVRYFPYLRGAIILGVRHDPSTMMRIIEGEELDSQEYPLFVIDDWRNQRIIEWTSNPQSLGNYFVPSDLPYQMSPAYFRPEVLMKYKQDPDRYLMREGWIECRGSWSLRRYGLNEAGQAFAYIGDLNKLPISEQRYWQSFNERPKAKLPKRTVATDFRGDWDDDPDDLELLRLLLSEFPSAKHYSKSVTIWDEGPNPDDLERLLYVFTESEKEWADEILRLSKIVVEGLQKQPIRKVAKSLDCDNPEWGSIRLLQACLEAKDVDTSVIEEVCEPLRSLWNARSKFGPAHRGQSEAPASWRLDFRQRVTDVLSAMKCLAELIVAGVFDLPAAAKMSEASSNGKNS